MKFIADLHIHSRYSMATSKSLNIPELSLWACRKGLDVIGTGDFTHPAWRNELKEWLRPDEESGLYKCVKNLPEEEISCRNSSGPFFMLEAEISCVYKRHGKTRKVHNLVYVPNFEIAERFSQKLSAIGNLNSDGRPILKLDSHDLLEILLEISPESVLIPAHVWTPWYSLFGSKSGFDRIEDCYADLTEHIFALETGLSSDPAMNRHLSLLDAYALVSNSDAHSAANLGREANIFSGRPSWQGIFTALRYAAKKRAPENLDCSFLGTMEFFPEEGKYHLDGHRNCGISLSPEESRHYDNICPVCHKPLTIGVLHRVLDLADRQQPAILTNDQGFVSLAPLSMILAEIMGVGASSAKVKNVFMQAIDALGPELDILCLVEQKQIRDWWEPLGEAIDRLRKGKIVLKAGFDGEYGKIRIFDKDELAALRSKKANCF